MYVQQLEPFLTLPKSFSVGYTEYLKKRAVYVFFFQPFFAGIKTYGVIVQHN